MKSTDKIKHIRSFMRGKFKTKFAKDCLRRGNPLAVAMHEALRE